MFSEARKQARSAGMKKGDIKKKVVLDTSVLVFGWRGCKGSKRKAGRNYRPCRYWLGDIPTTS